MEWKNILYIDGFKVIIIIILLSFPYIVSFGSHSSWPGGEMSLKAEEIHIGLPFSYINLEYVSEPRVGYFSRFSGSYLNFILNIIIAYLIGIMISLCYYRIKKK